MAIHIHPFDIPASYYKPIGQIVASWNLAEVIISSIIWHVLDIKDPEVGRLFTYRPSSVERLKILDVTMRHIKDPAIKAELAKLHSEADKLRGLRNTIIHGLWGRMPNEPKTWKLFYLKDTKDTVSLKRDVMTTQKISDIATRIRTLNVKLDELRVKIGAPPP
jgi:hypothetical protein